MLSHNRVTLKRRWLNPKSAYETIMQVGLLFQDKVRVYKGKHLEIGVVLCWANGLLILERSCRPAESVLLMLCAALLRKLCIISVGLCCVRHMVSVQRMRL